MKKNEVYYTPTLPLAKGTSYDYEYHDNIIDVIRQNLKNIILTNPGERVMDPSFGVGVSTYLFEQVGTFESDLATRIRSQIGKYASFVTVRDVIINSDGDNGIFVNISYRVDSINIEDNFSTTFKTDISTGGPKFVV